PYDLTSHLHPRPPYLTSYIGVRRKTYHPNRISLRRTPRPELKPRFLPMEAARNTTRPMNTAAAINGQRSATSISTAKTANVMHRLTNTLLLGSDISSNYNSTKICFAYFGFSPGGAPDKTKACLLF